MLYQNSYPKTDIFTDLISDQIQIYERRASKLSNTYLVMEKNVDGLVNSSIDNDSQMNDSFRSTRSFSFNMKNMLH